MSNLSNHIRAEKDYMKGMKYKEIAEKYNVSINTVKSWKQRYNWSRKGVHTKKKVCTQKKPGAPVGNINAKGNKGGGAPPGNKNAERHGLYAKFLPPETLELIDAVEKVNPIDLLWDQIKIQYAAIIRAQHIMHVKSQDDLTKVLKREKESSGMTSDSWEKEYELQFAWDKQASFLKAQSRAMGELRSMIRQYDELLRSELATEEQRARIAVLKEKVSEGKRDGVLKVQIIDDIPGDDI